ncbi:hypothetical protein GCM10010211_71810 [Streptomyces albospinus]|uniref:RNA polymerase sigma factor 70 region 4 type 2 domain-containing protein n=1 Tax=Streptomyces albospinus TaxID=285515 RepID=A0ABQ2VKL3_9ACTN|nr:sigma-70 family RNA polymerase sigma factor [Streptomyces albospinus]GGU94336.1 hypothetical protein GCM10010211_71810 [Streptomyces albospinus]
MLAELEASLIGRVFAALPERWQTVLWHTEVEGESPAQVAPLLGLSANAVAALACRAREGLRKEYFQAHLSEQEMARECCKCARKPAAYVRGPLGSRKRHRGRRTPRQVRALSPTAVGARPLGIRESDTTWLDPAPASGG